jgi:hypothetical protein
MLTIKILLKIKYFSILKIKLILFESYKINLMVNILNEGLPKPDPKKVIEELKSTLYSNDNF